MEILTITHEEGQIERRFEKLPSVLFDAIALQTTNDNWALKLNSCTIRFTLLCFNNENNIVGRLSEVFTPYVSPYQTMPIIHYNFASIQFNTNRLFVRVEDCAYFKVIIELDNSPLLANESFLINTCFTETSKIRINCNDRLSYWIYITDNNPRTPNQRTVTVLPIYCDVHGLDARDHINLVFNNNVSDEEIISSIKADPMFNCN